MSTAVTARQDALPGTMDTPVSLSRQAYDALLARLFDGVHEPGDLLNRREVATSLEMSVAPVLEAMVQLEAEGFLESIPRRGTRVRLVRREDLRGQTILREALEREAARYYCGDPVRDHMDELLRFADAIDRAASGHRDYLEADLQLHSALVRLAGVPALSDEYERVMRLSIFQQIGSLAPPEDRAYRDSHERLVRTLAESDPETAGTLLRRHIRSGKRYLFPEDPPA
jgi:GntR family transcriptional regulator, rspAB operon transcriptional repressor